MSRRFEPGQKLSEDDLAYLRARDNHAVLDAHAVEKLGGTSVEADTASEKTEETAEKPARKSSSKKTADK